MNCQDYLDLIRSEYGLISVLSQKNGAVVLRMRHIASGKDMIVRRYDVPVPAYRAIQSVLHRHLPEIYDCIMCEDGQIVLEEYVEGISVSQVLESGKYTYRGAKTVMIGLCKAVQTLHGMDIIHRDIKPENILISKDGTVKLIDLNASRKPSACKKQDTVILGTIGYAPPEQYGVGQSDRRADIYAMGVLLNVMLTGEHPSHRLARGKAGRIIKKCTLIDPNSRFSSVQKLMQAL